MGIGVTQPEPALAGSWDVSPWSRTAAGTREHWLLADPWFRASVRVGWVLGCLWGAQGFAYPRTDLAVTIKRSTGVF